MELIGSPVNNGHTQLTYLGWDRTGNITSSGTGIHHPRGDVMKISFDIDPINIFNNNISWTDGTTSPQNTHWRTFYDNGTVEPGSSGSPLLNSDKRVIGQLHGGSSDCSPVSDFYGRFDRSWTGGGTNSTRLSNWLDPNSTGATTANTIRVPSISGPDFICNQATYSINLPAGTPVQWSVYGGKAMLRLSADRTSATAVKTGNGLVEIRAPIPGGASVSRWVWAGTPVLGTLYCAGVQQEPAPNPPRLCVTRHASADNTWYFRNCYPLNGVVHCPPSIRFSYAWSALTPNFTLTQFTTDINAVTFYPRSPGTMAASVTASNVCGSCTGIYEFEAVNCSGGGVVIFRISPNPSTGETYVTLETSNEDSKNTPAWSIKIYDSMQRLVLNRENINGSELKVNTSSWSKGIYYVNVLHGGEIYGEKLVVQ